MLAQTTSFSLLDHLRDHGDAASWSRFARAYTPLLRFWVARGGLRGTDIDDVVQEVLLVVARRLVAGAVIGGHFLTWVELRGHPFGGVWVYAATLDERQMATGQAETTGQAILGAQWPRWRGIRDGSSLASMPATDWRLAEGDGHHPPQGCRV